MPDTRPVSFRDLTRLLERCGFTLTRVKGSHHLFTHPMTGTTIMLPDDSSTRPAMPVQVAGVRKILDERGVLSRDDFDAEVRVNGPVARPANGSPRGAPPESQPRSVKPAARPGRTPVLNMLDASNANVILVDHPVVQTKLTELRDYTTDHRKFRALLEEIASLMVYEVTRDWPTTPRLVQTPLERVTGRVLARRVTLVPILRAGLGMSEGVLRLLPEARLGHVGVSRDENTLEPVSYYHKLPPDIASTEVLLIDPMLATGGSGSAAVSLLKSAGVTGMRFVCLVAAPEGIQALHRLHPEVPIYCAAVDRQLNEKGYILPGLGDAGDRLFGT